MPDAVVCNNSHRTSYIAQRDTNVAFVPWAADAPKGCKMPVTMPAIEAQAYEKLRTLHCDRKAQSHDCHGRVILDRNGMTLQCPLCGDSRSVYRATSHA